MNIAVVLAGGTGQRMQREIPKQFIEVSGKPILAYTVECFEAHPEIDRVVIVCVEGWEDHVRNLAASGGYKKVAEVVRGGDNALSSTRIGIAASNCREDDIIVIHDGVRPLVDAASIDEVIADCRQYGGAISAVPLIEHVVYEGDGRTDLRYIPREKAYRTITPQAYRRSLLDEAFLKADATGAGSHSAFVGTMMIDLGMPVCLSRGSDKNIKITSPKDLVYFETVLKAL